jgi:hypothetical protein
MKIMMGMKDLMAKIVAIITTFLYVLDGSIKTMNSAWNGPPGQMVRVMGSCFHPETEVKLKNRVLVEIQNLRLGDVLENGSIVRATMKIDNYTDETLYKFIKQGPGGRDIYVSGTHMVETSDGKYIEVKNHPEAVLEDKKEKKWFVSLITSDHKIQIGKMTFWDWEDDCLK